MLDQWTKVCIHLCRSPSNTNIYQFLNDLEFLISHENENDSVRFVIGDVNIDLTNLGSTQVNDYLNTLSQYNYVSQINDFTRIQGNSKSCLDHIFIAGVNQSLIKACIIESSITDHFSQIIKILNNPLKNTKVEKNINPTY